MNLLRFARLPARLETAALDDGAIVSVLRGHKIEDRIRLGPNEVAFHVMHPDGSWDLSRTTNLLTNAGRDLLAAAMGQAAQKAGVCTATSATSATPSGGGLTTDQYKGWRVYMPITGITTVPVYGNIGSNSTTVLTIDGWWDASATDTMTGGTPASTNAYVIMPNAFARFMGLTTDTGAAAAGDTTLASELTTNGLSRAKSTYAHTGGNATYTESATFNVSGGPQTVHKGGLFTAANTTAAGIMVFETVANADAIVTTSDTLNATWTVTLSG